MDSNNRVRVYNQDEILLKKDGKFKRWWIQKMV